MPHQDGAHRCQIAQSIAEWTQRDAVLPQDCAGSVLPGHSGLPNPHTIGYPHRHRCRQSL